MTMAFRQVPIRFSDRKLLVLKAEHPVSKKTYFFVDLCLPFGSSISCAIFQTISSSITHIVRWRTNKPNLSYLDNYLFISLLKAWCDSQVNEFIKVCGYIQFPISMEKTYWGTTLLTFLGFLLDTVNQLVHIPIDKIKKALSLIERFTSKRKATVKEIEKLMGFFNFLCRCVVPGRAFTRRLFTHSG